MAYSGIIVQRVLCCRVGPAARDSKKPRPGCACGGLPVFCGWVIGRGGDIPAGGGLEAHAWVVWQGAVLNDSPDVAQRYAVLDQLNEQIHLPHTN